jgi:CHAT domain-containing protein/tetratricopeptide (TPR) repeat protein
LPESYEDTIFRLKCQVSEYYENGQYKEAVELAISMCNCILENKGEDDREYTFCIYNLAEMYCEFGDYSEAMPLYLRVLEIVRRVNGNNDDRVEVAAAMSKVGSIYRQLGDYSNAEPYYSEACRIYRKVLGNNHPEYAKSLNNLGLIHKQIGSYARAEPLYKEAIKIYMKLLEEADSHPEFNKGKIQNGYAQTLNNLSGIYYLIGDYLKAQQLLTETKEVRRTVLGERDPLYAQTLNNLAEVCELLGNYSRAEQLFLEAKEITFAVYGENHPQYANRLNNLAGLYEITQNPNAEQLYEQARSIYGKTVGEKSPEYVSSTNNLASLFLKKANFLEAENLYKQILDLYHKQSAQTKLNSRLVADTLHNLAILYVNRERFDEAMAIENEAATIDDNTIDQVFLTASERQRMVFLKAFESRFYTSLSLVNKHFAKSQSSKTWAFNLTLRRKGLLAEVLTLQRSEILGGKYPQLKETLSKLDMLSRQIVQNISEGVAVEITGNDSAQIRSLKEWINQKEDIESILARQIPEMMIQKKLKSTDNQSLARTLSEDEAIIEFVYFQPFDFGAVSILGKARWLPARYLAFVLLSSTENGLEMIDLGEATYLEEMILKFRSSVTHPVGGRHLEAFSKETQADKNLEKNEIRYGSALRKALFDSIRQYIGKRKRLFIAPDGELNTLPFEVLPFEDSTRRLIDEYHISYITTGRDIVTFANSSSSSINVLAANANPSLLVAADPDFDLTYSPSSTNILSGKSEDYESNYRRFHELNENKIHFSRLPGTRLEGETIARLLGITPLVDSNVLESYIKKPDTLYDIIHIATHGFFLPNQNMDPNKDRVLYKGSTMDMNDDDDVSFISSLENPLLRSGLALAGANAGMRGDPLPPEAEDGILLADDVTILDLSKTRLVVLSACETALGDKVVGEGVFGFRRSFVVAGAKAMVMSLWKVPDEQTQELMVNFYRHLLAGRTKIDALRDAQLLVKEKYPDPFYWGAFVCQGDPQPLAA